MTALELIARLQTLNPSAEVGCEVVTDDGERFDGEIDGFTAVPQPKITVYLET